MPTARLSEHAIVPNVADHPRLGEYEAPLSNRKAREVLGFQEAHNWRKYVKAG